MSTLPAPVASLSSMPPEVKREIKDTIHGSWLVEDGWRPRLKRFSIEMLDDPIHPSIAEWVSLFAPTLERLRIKTPLYGPQANPFRAPFPLVTHLTLECYSPLLQDLLLHFASCRVTHLVLRLPIEREPDSPVTLLPLLPLFPTLIFLSTSLHFDEADPIRDFCTASGIYLEDDNGPPSIYVDDDGNPTSIISFEEDDEEVD